MDATCPFCHVQVRPADYFCYNCGKNLHPAPPSVTIESQAMLYIGSILLPPLGIYWGWKYIRAQDQKSRIVGFIAVGLTVIALLLAISWTMSLINSVGSQLNQYQGLGL